MVRVTYRRSMAPCTRWRSYLLCNALEEGRKEKGGEENRKESTPQHLKRNAIGLPHSQRDKQISKCARARREEKKNHDCTSRFSKGGSGNVPPHLNPVHLLAQFSPVQSSEEEKRKGGEGTDYKALISTWKLKASSMKARAGKQGAACVFEARVVRVTYCRSNSWSILKMQHQKIKYRSKSANQKETARKL